MRVVKEKDYRSDGSEIGRCKGVMGVPLWDTGAGGEEEVESIIRGRNQITDEPYLMTKPSFNSPQDRRRERDG